MRLSTWLEPWHVFLPLILLVLAGACPVLIPIIIVWAVYRAYGGVARVNDDYLTRRWKRQNGYR